MFPLALMTLLSFSSYKHAAKHRAQWSEIEPQKEGLSRDTYSNIEFSVVEEQSSVGAYESVFIFVSKSGYCNLCHFSYLIII